MAKRRKHNCAQYCLYLVYKNTRNCFHWLWVQCYLRVPVDPPQSRSGPGRSAPRTPQVRSFHPRCWVVPPQLFGRLTPMLCRPTLVPYSRGGWWGLKHKNWVFGNIRITQYINQSLKWGGMGWYGIPPSQSLSQGSTVYKRQKERLGNVPFCI